MKKEPLEQEIYFYKSRALEAYFEKNLINQFYQLNNIATVLFTLDTEHQLKVLSLQEKTKSNNDRNIPHI